MLDFQVKPWKWHVMFDIIKIQSNNIGDCHVANLIISRRLPGIFSCAARVSNELTQLHENVCVCVCACVRACVCFNFGNFY